MGYCLSFQLNRAGGPGPQAARRLVLASGSTSFRGLDNCANSSISVQKISWCEKHRPIPGLCIREPGTVASGKICCNNSCALDKMSAFDDEVLPLSYGLNLSECGGKSISNAVNQEVSVSAEGRPHRTCCQGRRKRTDREYPLCTNERHHPNCGIRYCLREPPAT